MTSYKKFCKLEQSFSYLTEPPNNRVKIGLIQLSTDHILEPDLAKLAGKQACILSNRVFSNSLLTTDSLSHIANGIKDSAYLIAQGMPLDVMVFGCTSATFVIGENIISDYLTAHHPNIPTTNPWSATKAAMKYFNAKKIAVISPYPTPVNYTLFTKLQEAGFDVTAFASFGIEKDIYVPEISKKSIFSVLDKILPQSQVDCVFLSCTNLPVLDYLAEIEERFHIPAISSNSSLFWHAMISAGVTPVCDPQFGRLLHQNMKH